MPKTQKHYSDSSSKSCSAAASIPGRQMQDRSQSSLDRNKPGLARLDQCPPVMQASSPTQWALPNGLFLGDDASCDTRKRTGRKSMSRRSGQSSSIQKDGKWYVVRYWKDVEGQQKRQRVRAKICPISGPGILSASEREPRRSSQKAE